MMLWRRSKPAQMAQGNRHIMPRSVSASGRTSPTTGIPPCKNLTSFLSFPILFPGCSSKFLFGSESSDPSMSPTSTLDDSVFVRSASFGRVAIGLLGILHDGGGGGISPGSPNSTSILTAATQMKVNIPSFRRTNSAISPADTNSEEGNNLVSSVSTNGSPSVQLRGSELVSSLYGNEIGRDECYEIQPSSEEEEDTDGGSLPLEEAESESVCQNSMQSFHEIPVPPKGYHLRPPSSVRVIDASNFVGSLPYSVGSVRRSLSVSDIDLSEDYTRIVDRGPNPKTTHIFGDWVVETCGKGLAGVSSEQHDVGL